MELKVIGAGFPRTGTSTLKRALEIVGHKQCYHMKNLLIDPFRLPYWNRLKEEGTTDWDRLFDGFDAIVDIPGYLYYPKLMKQYPNAKVILSIRPFERWYASVQATVKPAVYPSVGKKLGMLGKLISSKRVRNALHCIEMVKETFFKGHFEGKFDNKERAEEIYLSHIEQVKAQVPSDRLLVYRVSDGWEPLCQFLQVPVPQEAFPHLNKKENFSSMIKQLVNGQMA